MLTRGIKPSTGFTLVEMVAVIVLLGIVAVASTQFIRQGVEIYTDTARRDSLQQQGRFAVERVSRELRNALPGSVRVESDCIEFAPIEAGSSYLGNVGDSQETSFQAVDFNYTTAAVTNRRVAVYTIEPKDVYNYNRKAVVDLDDVDAVAASQRQINLKNYSGPGHRFRSESPSKRFYIITEPVSFCVRGTDLYRHDAYGWNLNQQTGIGVIGAGILLAENIQTTDGGAVTVFDYSAGTLQRSGVAHLDMRFMEASDTDEWVRFSHEVFVRNVP